MNLLPPEPLQELLVFDVWERIRDFEESVADLHGDLEKDFKNFLPEMMPLLDNYYLTESEVGAAVYNLWERYSPIDSRDLEVYTDALMCLLDSIASIMYLLHIYNHEGVCIYKFERMLGNSVVMRLKNLDPGDYQLF